MATQDIRLVQDQQIVITVDDAECTKIMATDYKALCIGYNTQAEQTIRYYSGPSIVFKITYHTKKAFVFIVYLLSNTYHQWLNTITNHKLQVTVTSTCILH